MLASSSARAPEKSGVYEASVAKPRRQNWTAQKLRPTARRVGRMRA